MSNTATYFLAFLITVAIIVVVIAKWRLPTKTALRVGFGIALWLVYISVLSLSGLIANTEQKPPAILAIVLPIFIFVVFAIVRSDGAKTVAMAVPLWLLMGLQSYRVGVEFFLNQLWHEGLLPRMLTYAGPNVDIWIGVTAPNAAWLSTRSGLGSKRISAAWNVIGLLPLANVIVRSALTSPGPLHLLASEVSNRAIGTFPYTFIAGFFAPLAITLHVLALRSIAIQHIPTTKTKEI